MSADKRNERMLEEILRIPGNEVCADCRASAPRWASVNLGIFLCVNCASVHRKMGTHRSRVKSVTLDSWTRENIIAMRQKGNKLSNAEWNPHEHLHPPPTSLSTEERDSELEKYIRRKYEQGAFKAGAGAMAPPTSLNRAREAQGRLPNVGAEGQAGHVWASNKRNPESNGILEKKPGGVVDTNRDLPALPLGATGAVPRPRPAASSSSGSATPPLNSAAAAGSGSGSLVNLHGGVSSTLPLQVTSQYAPDKFNPFHQFSNPSQQQMSPQQPAPAPTFSYASGQQYPQGSNLYPPSNSSLSTSPLGFSNHPLAAFDPLAPAQQPQLPHQQLQHQQQQQHFQQSQCHQQQFPPQHAVGIAGHNTGLQPHQSFFQPHSTGYSPVFAGQYVIGPNMQNSGMGYPQYAGQGQYTMNGMMR